MLDTACGFAASTAIDGYVLASQLSIRFLRPAVAETFLVRGRIVKPGRRQVFAAPELFADGGDPAKPFALGDAVMVPAK